MTCLSITSSDWKVSVNACKGSWLLGSRKIPQLLSDREREKKRRFPHSRERWHGLADDDRNQKSGVGPEEGKGWGTRVGQLGDSLRGTTKENVIGRGMGWKRKEKKGRSLKLYERSAFEGQEKEGPDRDSDNLGTSWDASAKLNNRVDHNLLWKRRKRKSWIFEELQILTGRSLSAMDRVLSMWA